MFTWTDFNLSEMEDTVCVISVMFRDVEAALSVSIFSIVLLLSTVDTNCIYKTNIHVLHNGLGLKTHLLSVRFRKSNGEISEKTILLSTYLKSC